MKVRANQVGIFGGRRRKPGEEFEVPDTFRLARWMDPVDANVPHPSPRRAGVIIGRPVGAQRVEAGRPVPTTLHAMAHGESLVLKQKLADADAVIADMAAKLEAALQRLAVLEGTTQHTPDKTPPEDDFA